MTKRQQNIARIVENVFWRKVEVEVEVEEVVEVVAVVEVVEVVEVGRSGG